MQILHDSIDKDHVWKAVGRTQVKRLILLFWKVSVKYCFMRTRNWSSSGILKPSVTDAPRKTSDTGSCCLAFLNNF